ncbi:hypothetical protein BGZ95_005081 [Linnemannia exigua]|uniref:Coiled-coil domain-containing protein 16 n=1 Tax=Linnemannia exigua TaxID=604196 RepID=A0AAD4H7T8_9FUNG|nr:hypothetical protein BGZ95_005081 [Linnemannia exigua]
MSKDVRRLFAAQKAAKAGAASPSSPSLSASASKRVTHPLAKYDSKTFRLTCAICGPAVPIKSDSLWNAHLVSKAHQEAVAKLRAVKEQMQRKEAEAAGQRRLQQEQQRQQQQQTQAQEHGVKRKAAGGLVAYADDSESDSDDEETTAAATSNNQAAVTSDFKRVKLDETSEQDLRREVEQDIEDEEEAMSGLPAGFFDTPPVAASEPSQDVGDERIPQEQETEPESMEGVLPAGFFDNPEEDARVRAEVGGATADQQQRQVDAEFKALEAELARDLERQEKQDAQIRSGEAVERTPAVTTNGTTSTSEHIAFEEKVELEEQELEESIMARSEEEYLLFVEMQERLDALREKKNRLLTHQPSHGAGSTTSPSASVSSSNTKSKLGKAKSKSILDLVREQELAKKEKERQAAAAFAKANADRGDSRMDGDDDDEDEDESDEDDEDIEAMMDWRARRV